MGTSTKEKGVLKLVHPGRHVEYHQRSITAGEIMRKYPRHSITRPDFFKYPNTVVRPESVMVPGQVFFIVPNTAIHRLLKAKGQQHGEPSSKQTKPPNTNDHRHDHEQTSPCTLWAGKTPMYQFHHKQEGSSSCCGSLPHAEENQETIKGSIVDDTWDDRLSVTFQARDYYLNGNRSAWARNTIYGRDETKSNKQDKPLKSCMKKKVASNPRIVERDLLKEN